MSGYARRRGRSAGIAFSRTEIRDLLAAWAALGVAFAVFFGGGTYAFDPLPSFVRLLGISLLTAGIGFLLHELAHKVIAVRFGQVAEFRANYPMLAIAIAAAFAGFIFAAPGAVYHRGRITVKQNGLIALAGPVTNVILGLAFLPLVLAPIVFVADVGRYGVLINFFLAAFNMIPYGPLDGRKVRDWSTLAFVGTLLVSIALLAWSIIFLLF